MTRLTLKQQKFVDAYEGNATEALRKAGYRGSDKSLWVIGSRLLRLAKVLDAIKARNAGKVNPDIATREERQRFWTTVMRDSSLEIQARIKASELLGKSEADFKESVDVSGTFNIDGLSKWILEMRRARGLPDE